MGDVFTIRRRQLQRCCEHKALTNGCDDGFAVVPAFIVPVGKIIALPFTRGHEARSFSEDIDSGLASQAKARQIFVNIVDAETTAEFVKIDVAGLGKGIVKIDRPVTLRFPVPVAMLVAFELEIANANAFSGQIGSACLERGQRQHRFDRGSRRIRTTNRTVEKRAVQVVLQFAVLGRAHADGEQIRIE